MRLGTGNQSHIRSEKPEGCRWFVHISNTPLLALTLTPFCCVPVSMWHHSRSKNFGYTGPFEHFVKVREESKSRKNEGPNYPTSNRSLHTALHQEMFLRGRLESGDWFAFVLECFAATKEAEAKAATRVLEPSPVANLARNDAPALPAASSAPAPSTVATSNGNPFLLLRLVGPTQTRSSSACSRAEDNRLIYR